MERLDLRLVEYFVVLAEELHFGRAAARLHIAQPSLSQQIRRLEETLGVTLLERTSRRVELTPAGAALLRGGRRILRQASHVVDDVRASGCERLAIGFYGSAGTTVLPGILAAYGERHPNVQVSLRELLLGSVEDLLCGDVDVAFTRLRPGQSDLAITIKVLAREARVVALPTDHRLTDRAPLAFADLRDETFITNPAFPAAGPPARWLSEQRAHGLPGHVAAEATSIQEILTLVASGRGVCLVPASVARDYPRDRVSYADVADAEPALVSLAWQDHDLRPAVAAFVEIASEYASGADTADPDAALDGTLVR